MPDILEGEAGKERAEGQRGEQEDLQINQTRQKGKEREERKPQVYKNKK